MSMHRFRSVVRVTATLGVVLVLASGGVGLTAQQSDLGPTANVPALSAPFKTVNLSLMPRNQATVPFFSHGYFIQFKRRTTSAGESNIFLFDSYGQFAHEVAVRPDGATSMFLTSVDVGADGQLAFAGQARLETGRPLLFIATSDLDGKHPSYIDTGDYRASQIAVADNGSIWAIGAERPEISQDQATGANVRKWQNYDMLRHYSSTGVLLEHFLPRWEARVAHFSATQDNAGHTVWAAYDAHGRRTATDLGDRKWSNEDAWQSSEEVFLRFNNGRLVFFGGANNQLYIHDNNTGTVLPFSLVHKLPTSMRTTGLAVTGLGQIYVSMISNPMMARQTTLFCVMSVTSGGVLTARKVFSAGAGSSKDSLTLLLGADGDNVVYRAPLNTDQSSVDWSTTTPSTN